MNIEKSFAGGYHIEKSGEIFPPEEAAILDENVVSRLQERVFINQELQKAITEEGDEISLHKKHWADYSAREWSNQPTVPVAAFLKQHGTVEQNATHEKKVRDKQWTESLRWSNAAEKEFLSAAMRIGDGQFVEVLQIALEREGVIIAKDATVGSGIEVTQKSIDEVVSNLDIETANPATVYVIHNHPDEYADFMLPDNTEPVDGLATEGGLSKRDIDFADKLWEETLGKKRRVVMVAINERELTFAYEAGTSQPRDWESEAKKGK